jgi:hypothetical protein
LDAIPPVTLGCLGSSVFVSFAGSLLTVLGGAVTVTFRWPFTFSEGTGDSGLKSFLDVGGAESTLEVGMVSFLAAAIGDTTSAGEREADAAALRVGLRTAAVGEATSLEGVFNVGRRDAADGDETSFVAAFKVGRRDAADGDETSLVDAFKVGRRDWVGDKGAVTDSELFSND